MYPDGCLTAWYPTHLGVVEGAKEVLASVRDAPDGDPSDDHFADADHAIFGMELPTAAEHVPECQHL